MLGVRLSTEFETRLDRIARDTQRNKSDLAREALEAFVERHDFAPEARRQSLAAAARPRTDHDDFWESVGTLSDPGE